MGSFLDLANSGDKIDGGGGFGSMLGGIGTLLGGPFGGAIGNLVGGLFGGGAAKKALDQGRKDLMNLPGMQGPVGLSGNFGSSNNGAFQMNPAMMANQMNLQGTANQLLGGGLFNNAGFQQAFGQNDMAGALGQSNQALMQQMGPQAFGGLGGLFGQAQGLSQQYGNQLGQNFGALQGQELDAMRAAAQPQQDRMFNKMQNRLHSMGMLGSTGGGQQMQGLFDSFGQQDLNFQTQSFDRAMQQRAQQMQGYQNFTGMASGLEGQGFGQGLQSLQQNQSAGMNRLNQAMGLFGQGADIYGQQYGLGLQGAGAGLDFSNFGLNAASMPYQLQAQLLQGSGEHASGIANMAGQSAQAGGGMFSGIGKAIGGLFSDRRLKTNLKKVGKLNDFDLYTWEWNDTAKALGIDAQTTIGVIAQEVEEFVPAAVTTDPETGYKKVDYEVLAHG